MPVRFVVLEGTSCTRGAFPTTGVRIEAADEERASRTAPTTTPPLDGTLVATTLLLAGWLLPVLAYLRAFGASLHPLGPDLFGYIWQTRIVGHAALSSIEARPGVPILGSVLAGLGVTSDGSAALVVAPVMMVALGFAVAVALRSAFHLPRWSVGVLGFVVALWGGSVHLAQGHLANLLSLVCIVPTVLLVAVPGGSWRMRLLGAVATATASGFAHAGFLPFYAAAAGLWLVLSIPSLARTRREGARWWQEPACSFVLALIGASALVALVIFGVIGTSVEGFTNIDDGITEFGDRLAQIVIDVGLWVSATTVLAVVGVVAAWRLSGSSSRALTLVGVAWTAASATGGLVAIARPSFPGHRAVGVLLPLPAMTALGIVGIALAIAGWRRPASGQRAGVGSARALGAACAVAALSVLVVSPGLEGLAELADRKPKGELARTIASYVAAVDPQVPVVVFADPPGRQAGLSWRGRQNQIRALVPTGSIDRIFVLVGRLGEDGLPEPVVAPDRATNEAFTYAVQQSWSAGGASMQEGAIVVVPQTYVRKPVWERIAAMRPSQVVMPGLAVLRGPHTTPKKLVPAATLPVARAARQAIACLLVVTLIGVGYGVVVAWARGGSVLDAVALAPSFGMVVVLLIGVAVGVPGLDPAGAPGLVLVGLGAAGGYVLAWRQRERRRVAA
jgi:hypothetical protein